MHSDTHDVFVLQTAGHQAVGGARRPTAIEEPLLEPGHVDVPAHRHPARRPRAGHRLAARHHRHQPAHLARPGRARRSSSLAAEVPAEHLPAGYLDDPQALAHQLGRHLSDIADRLRAVDPAAVVDERGAPLPHLAAAPARGRRWSTGSPLDAIDDDTLLRRRARPPVRAASTTGDRLEVLLGDRTLDVPARLRPALEEVRDRPSCARRPADARRAEPAGAVPTAGPGGAARGRPG